MPRPRTDGPTERELEILRILWQRGKSTARDIHSALNEGLSKKDQAAYNSVLTILLIMLEKGLVSRDESQKSHVYEAAYKQDDIQEQMLEGFIEKVFGGSAMNLVTKALSMQATNKKDAEKIKSLLEEMAAEDGKRK
jgi:BlaI family transcriptional regulator, penicillinase repressor